MCLCLTYFTLYDNLLVHSCCSKWHDFNLFRNWVVFHCIYHIFFIHSSVDGCLTCCFHVLAIIEIGCMCLFKLYVQEWGCWIIW